MRRRELASLIAGALATAAFAARGQQKPTDVQIGVLFLGSIESPEGRVVANTLREALSALGHIEGRNISIEYRAAGGNIERLPLLARELVELKVAIILAGGTIVGKAAQQATASIPIVVTSMGDPVHDGFVANLARPGGNVTGTAFLGPELVPKQLELLRDLLPGLSRVVLLWHPGAYGDSTMANMLEQAKAAGVAMALRLDFVEAHDPEKLGAAFSAIDTVRPQALFLAPSPMLWQARRRVVELISTKHLPAIFGAREFVELGGLIAYGTNQVALQRRAASYVDKILKGAKPADLPVEQPTKFELVINLKTAKVLGLTVPQSLLARADEVIE
jgi:putative ABC transport system substrate-binding protein